MTTIHEAAQTRAANTTSPTPAGDGQLHAGSKGDTHMENGRIIPTPGTENILLPPCFDSTGDLVIGKDTGFTAIWLNGDKTTALSPVVGFRRNVIGSTTTFEAMVMHPWLGGLMPAQKIPGFVGVVSTFKGENTGQRAIAPAWAGARSGGEGVDVSPFYRELERRFKKAETWVEAERKSRAAKEAKAAKKEVSK